MSFTESISKNAAGSVVIQFKDGSSQLIPSAVSTFGLGIVPLGAVIATFPNLTGAYTAPSATPDSSGFVLCDGATVNDLGGPMHGVVVPTINNGTFLAGSTKVNSNSASNLGTAAAASSVTLASGNLPTHTHDINHTHPADTSGSTAPAHVHGGTGLTVSLSNNTGIQSGSHAHTTAHGWEWNNSNGTFTEYWSLDGSQQQAQYGSAVTFPSYDRFEATHVASVAGTGVRQSFTAATVGGTTIGISSIGGSTASTSPAHTHSTPALTLGSTQSGSGGFANTAFNIIPKYLTATYVMRVR